MDEELKAAALQYREMIVTSYDATGEMLLNEMEKNKPEQREIDRYVARRLALKDCIDRFDMIVRPFTYDR